MNHHITLHTNISYTHIYIYIIKDTHSLNENKRKMKIKQYPTNGIILINM